MSKILLLEDDPIFADVVKDWLEGERHFIEHILDGEAGFYNLCNYDYDVAIIDWDLPGKSGVDAVKEYRNLGGKTPILLLTAKGAIAEKEVGLDSGADDYLTKPCNMRELSARVRALSRRGGELRPTVLAYGNIVLDPANKQVTVSNSPVVLLPTEYALLEFLLANPERTFTAQTLLRKVWKSDSEATENCVRTYVTRLRKKIQTDELDSPEIGNIHGVGYILRKPQSLPLDD